MKFSTALATYSLIHGRIAAPAFFPHPWTAISDSSGLPFWTATDINPYDANAVSATAWPIGSDSQLTVQNASAAFPANGGLIKLTEQNLAIEAGLLLSYENYSAGTFTGIAPILASDVEGNSLLPTVTLSNGGDASVVFVGLKTTIEQGTRDDWPGFIGIQDWERVLLSATVLVNFGACTPIVSGKTPTSREMTMLETRST